MTKIHLKNGYYIVPKKSGYELHLQLLKISPKTGKPSETKRRLGFHNTIGGCIGQYIELLQNELTEAEDLTLQEYAERCELCAKLAVTGLEEEIAVYLQQNQ